MALLITLFIDRHKDFILGIIFLFITFPLLCVLLLVEKVFGSTVFDTIIELYHLAILVPVLAVCALVAIFIRAYRNGFLKFVAVLFYILWRLGHLVDLCFVTTQFAAGAIYKLPATISKLTIPIISIFRGCYFTIILYYLFFFS